MADLFDGYYIPMDFVDELWSFAVAVEVLRGRGFVRCLSSVTNYVLVLYSSIGEPLRGGTVISMW